jgi:oxalate---CoA ligase
MIFSGHVVGGIVEPDGRRVEKNQLQKQIHFASCDLSARLVGPRDRILICHDGSAQFFSDLMAVWQVGACAVCVSQRVSQFELEAIVAFVKPRAIIRRYDQDLELPDRNVLCLEMPRQGFVSPQGFPARSGSLDDDALILFTSGTTGSPKGVVHTFRSLLARINLNQLMIGKKDLERTLCPLPTYFGHGLIGNCLTPWLSGGDVHLYPTSDLSRAATIGRYIEKEGISFMSSVPSMWKIVAKVADSPNARVLRRVHVGSAPLSKDLWKSIINWCGTSSVVNMYGITETANWFGGASAAEMEPEDGLVGKPWGGCAVVRSDKGHLAPTGEGELLLQTPSLMRGYFARSDLTAEVIEHGMLATGDLGSVDELGIVRVVGRRKYEINRAGMKVSPEELDSLFEQHPDVDEACTFKISDEIAGELIGIALVPNDCRILGAEKAEGLLRESIRSWAKKRLVQEKIPDYWFFSSEIPKTSRGKIRRDDVASICLKVH